MGSIYDIFNIGKLGIRAQQAAMQVTAHNIANVNTEGYTRQDVVFTETTPLNENPGQVGTGVQVSAITRKYDSFIEGQIIDGKEKYGNLDAQKAAFSKIESLFYSDKESSIGTLLDQFFEALQDLTVNPSGSPERITVISKAEVLTNAINDLHSNLVQVQKDTNTQISQTIDEINQLTSEIAELNDKIGQAEIAGQNANDYRDMRGRLIKDLAERIDISFFEDSTGQVTIISAGTALLVERNSSWNLQLTSNPDNSGYYNITYTNSSNTTSDITSDISEGKLKGLLEIRDTVVPDYIDKLDRYAAAFANEINQAHRNGYDLNGTNGRNLFTPNFEAGDSVYSKGLSSNTGSGSVAVTIDNPANLTYHNYELTFSSGNYTVTNKSTGNSTSGTYSDPTTVTFEGLSINITGTHDSGDKYIISAHKDTAKNISVAISSDNPDQIAAAEASSNNRDDNRNALTLVQLKDKLSIDGVSTFNSFFESIVGEIGADTQYINNSHTVQEFSLEQLNNMRESVSGVSLDEEMTNLLQLQSAFEASSKLIGISDELLQELLNMI